MPDKPNVILDIIAVTYQQDHPLRCFVESIKSQTNPSWRLLIIHDGPDIPEFLRLEPTDDRIKILVTKERFNDWGHTLRDIGLRRIKSDSAYTLITNADNYYTPNFIDEMCMTGNEDLVYCNCVHSHWKYEARETALHRRAIDIGAVVVNTKMAKQVGFKSRLYYADWLYFDEIIKTCSPTIRKVNKVLFVHN